MTIKPDVLVIGGGPGGYVAAIKLGQLGKKALVVDRDKLGGECLNYGCIPSKALIAAANKESSKNDWGKVVAWKDQMIGGFGKNIGALVKGNKGSVLFGAARFTSPHAAVVEKADGGTETVEFEQAIVATGSQALTIPGFDIDGKVRRIILISEQFSAIAARRQRPGPGNISRRRFRRGRSHRKSGFRTGSGERGCLSCYSALRAKNRANQARGSVHSRMSANPADARRAEKSSGEYLYEFSV